MCGSSKSNSSFSLKDSLVNSPFISLITSKGNLFEREGFIFTFVDLDIELIYYSLLIF